MALKVIIVGGVAGGASAAARLRRLDENAEIVLLERGPDVSFANCGLPYHIAGEIRDRDELAVQTAEGLRTRMRLDVRTLHEATGVDAARRVVRVKDLSTGREFEEGYDALILSPGAAPVVPPIAGMDLPGVHTLRTLADMDRIKARVDAKAAGRALVLGGGFIGLEMAEALRRRGWDVLLAERGSQLLAPADPEMAVLLARELALHGVEVALGAALTAVRPDRGRLAAEFGTRVELVDLVLVAVGVRPETALARSAGLALGPGGGILVDGSQRTSDPHIYAVGDAVEVRDPITGRSGPVALAGPANRQGRAAADAIVGRPTAYPGTLGTAIVRVFGLVFGLTGASEHALKAAGRAYTRAYLHPNQHAGYYPGAVPMAIKLLFDPGDGRILGVQVAGSEGVDKRLDVFATALRAGWTVRDLEGLELSYAPPFGSAKDPVNMAGFVAANILDHVVESAGPEEAEGPREGRLLLDVRTPEEFAAGAVPGAVNIPVDELRGRLGEIPADKEVLVYCRVGHRGYLACRVLSQAGFRARNLGGGWLTYQAWKQARAMAEGGTPARPTLAPR